MKEIRALNLEAAVRSDSRDILYENTDLTSSNLHEFVEKVSSIKKELNLKSHELEALQEISQIITATFDVKTISQYIYTIFNSFTDCDRYLICLTNKDNESLAYKYEFGTIMFNEIGNVVNKDSLIVQCFESKQSLRRLNVLIKKRQCFGDQIAIPLHTSGETVGVLYIEKGQPGAFNDVNMDFLESMAVYASIAIKNAEMYSSIYEQKQEIEALYEETAAINEQLSGYIEELNRTKEELNDKNTEITRFCNEMQTGYFQTVMALANSIEANDSYTRGHCQRVMEISCELGKNLEMSDKQIEILKYSAILHDIGKIGVPPAILNKNEKLTEEELEEIKKHPLTAYSILKDVEFIQEGIEGILQHHERSDGNGYPHGLKNDDICLNAKILCIADAFDAMTTDRPYRKGMSMKNALKEIERCKGSQFDVKIANLFINSNQKLLEESERSF